MSAVTAPDAVPRARHVRLVRQPDRPGGVRVEGTPTARFGRRFRRPGQQTPEGVFAAWHWDGTQLRAENDRYGAFPLFYWSGPDGVALSTDPVDLLALGAPARPDHDALSVFVRTGFLLAEDTCFAAVRALPPCATLTWSPGRLRVESRQPSPAARGPVTNRRRAVDGCIDLFRAAVARRLPEESYVLPLSGGRDSRHLLLELVRQGSPPRLCVTGRKFPPDSGADVRVAGELADRLRIPWQPLARPRSEFHAELVANRAQGMVSVEGAWALPVLAHLRGRTRLTYSGLGGDSLLRPGQALALLREHDLDPADLPGTADALLRNSRTGPYVECLLGPRLTRLWSRQRARSRLVTELARHTRAAFPLGSFFFWNRMRRVLAATTYGLLAAGPVTHAPYLDHELFDFLGSVPGRLLVDGGFHDAVLHRAFPQHSEVGFADATPAGHPAALPLHRLAYLARLLTHALTEDRSWWRGADRLLPRLLACGLGPSAPRRVSRLMPLAVHLLQLDALCTRELADS